MSDIAEMSHRLCVIALDRQKNIEFCITLNHSATSNHIKTIRKLINTQPVLYIFFIIATIQTKAVLKHEYCLDLNAIYK
jgi:hypothetical protein